MELGVGLLQVVVLVVVRIEGQGGAVDDAAVKDKLVDVGELGCIELQVGKLAADFVQVGLHRVHHFQDFGVGIEPDRVKMAAFNHNLSLARVVGEKVLGFIIADVPVFALLVGGFKVVVPGVPHTQQLPGRGIERVEFVAEGVKDFDGRIALLRDRGEVIVRDGLVAVFVRDFLDAFEDLVVFLLSGLGLGRD